MPELPEVETVRVGLATVLEGQQIQHIRLNRPDLRFPFPEHFAERLEGTTIEPLKRRAKYLIMPLSSGESVIIHLGMSGRVLIEREAIDIPGQFHHRIDRHIQHDHVVISLRSGVRVIYNDVRRFGFMLLTKSDALDAHPMLAGLGPEPLSNHFHAQSLGSALERRASPIKSALLDQQVVAGLGNIYVLEALHRVQISPFRRADGLSGTEIAALVVAIREILQEAIAAGGSSLRDFRHEDGSLGYFQHGFAVYGREGEACRRAGCRGTIKRQVQAGRSSFYCADCQQ